MLVLPAKLQFRLLFAISAALSYILRCKISSVNVVSVEDFARIVVLKPMLKSETDGRQASCLRYGDEVVGMRELKRLGLRPSKLDP